MMQITLLPRRFRHLPELKKEELRKPLFSNLVINSIPNEIIHITGNIIGIEPSEQGVCNLVLLVKAEKGLFILKIARGEYRSVENFAEHTIMQELYKSHIPVPNSLFFIKKDDTSFQLREYLPGAPLSFALKEKNQRIGLYGQLGSVLRQIHDIEIMYSDWQDWLQYALVQAKINMKNDVIDLAEFENNTPHTLLNWLNENKPKPSKVTLLHGDYRPKNILWNTNSMSGVLDWAFADFGDPYYDIAIAIETIENKSELNAFLYGYEIKKLDLERLHYMQNLVKFINV